MIYIGFRAQTAAHHRIKGKARDKRDESEAEEGSMLRRSGHISAAYGNV